MFVEISGRGTGKTTRMVDNIIDFLNNNPDKQVLIASPKPEGRKYITKMIHEKCGDPCSKRSITSYRMIKTGDSMKQFVDDFDHMNEDYMIMEDGCYYTGSDAPMGICEDILNKYKETGDATPSKVIKRHKL